MDQAEPPSGFASANGAIGPDRLPPAAAREDQLLASQEIERALGLSVRQALDLQSWDENGGLEKLWTRVQSHILKTAHQECRLHEEVRRSVLTELPRFHDAPAQAGVYRVSDEQLRAACRQHLVGGTVTAAHGASTGHDSLAATLVSVGVSIVRYDGAMRSWRTTFLRQDYDFTSRDAAAEVRAVLDRRGRRSPEGPGNLGRDHLTTLLRRGFTTAAERKALLEKAGTPWRLGRGVPAPLELLTGSGSSDLLDEVLPVLRHLLLDDQRWCFIPAAQGNLALATLANALQEKEIAIFQKGKAALDTILEAGHFEHGYRRAVVELAERLGEAMVYGGFRATRFAPAQLFVAHAEHALAAGTIAMADASLQPHRGYPLLLDLAGLNAKMGLGIDAYQGVAEAAYAKAGVGGLLASERILTDL